LSALTTINNVVNFWSPTTVKMSLLSTIGGLFGWTQPPSSTWHYPSYEDVCEARAHLKALNLPTELVLQILDHAQYWPQVDFAANPRQPIVAASQGNQNCYAALCLDAGVFDNAVVSAIRKGGEVAKIKSLEFHMVSRDQGWVSGNTRGTYSTSSWLEVSILRSLNDDHRQSPTTHYQNVDFYSPSDFHEAVSDDGWELVKRPESAEQGPQGGEGDFAWYLQGNRVAVGWDEYRVLWAEDRIEGNEGAGSGAGFLQELKEGDRVLVWARAKVCCCCNRLLVQIELIKDSIWGGEPSLMNSA
jgi:hypothetical protein